ncbi:MAG TPA: hypothetical protein DCS93_09615 [Microscillaceae bacterium]|nr:hypothetical protein [Microscillaceae bacterium]
MIKKPNVKCWQISFATFLMSWMLTFSGYSQFITTWKARNGQITIPGKGNYTVTWEHVNNPADNGTVNATDGVTINMLAFSATYKVSITGGLTQVQFTSGTNADKLLSIEQWGNIAWTSMEEAFHGCRNMTYNATDTPDLSRVTSLRAMFRNCQNFNGDIRNWNTSNITDMSQMFSFAFKFNQPIGSWDVSKVTNMQEMFISTSAFDQPIGNWNTSKVTNMEAMFQNASSFNQPIENWDVSNVTTMRRMFYILIILTDNNQQGTIRHRTTGTKSKFNQPLNNWNTGYVTDMEAMFANADSFNQPLNNWNTGNVATMQTMFQQATNFNQNLGGWNITKATNLNNMLSGSGLSLGNYDRTLNGWTTQNVKSGVNLGANNLKFCAAEANRNTLTTTKNWTITGDMKACPTRDIEVLLDNIEISTGGTADFGLGTSVVKTFTIRNIGTTSALALSGTPIVVVTASTAFAVSQQPSAASIATSASLTFEVTYTGATNNDTGTLSIVSNDPDEPTYTIELKGILKKTDQTITFDLGNNAIKAFGEATFDLTATGGASGNVVTFSSSNTSVATISGNTVTIVGIGTTTITASQGGNTLYNAAPNVTQTLTVNKAKQTITFDLGNSATKTFGDAAFDLTATGGASGNPVTFASSDANVVTISGNTVTIVGAGTTNITASQAGNNNYNAAADVAQTLTVNKANQAITFDLGNNATKALGDAAFDLTATGGASGNPIIFTSSNTGVATISGKTVTIVGAGTTTITASQIGNDNYNTAADITQTLTVQSTITALPQDLKVGKVSVYPNPTSHMIKIKVTGKNSRNYVEVIVLNQQGKKVLLMGQSIKNGQIEIPIDQLKAGEYILQMNIGEETIIRRIVKI